MVNDSFTSRLHVNTITLTSLSSSQEYELSNYYVTLSYGIWKISTALNQSQGREICWKYPASDLNMIFHVSIDELISQKFQVQVWNHEGNILQGGGVCTLESSLKSITNNVICVSLFLVDNNHKEFGIANILIQVLKSGFLTNTSQSQTSSPSRLPLHPTSTSATTTTSTATTYHTPTITIPTESLRQHSPSTPSFTTEPHSTVKAAVTKVNPDGTCTIRLENDEMKEIQFVTGIFQISSEFKHGDLVDISYPGSISHSFPAIISRAHPDGTFSVKYHNGTREMRLHPKDIKKRVDETANNTRKVISERDIEEGCQTITELNQRINQQTNQTQLISNQLDTTQHIFKRFTELYRQYPQQERGYNTPSHTISWEQRQREREEHFTNQQKSELSRRHDLEKRIEEMKRFSIPTYLPEQHNTKHLNLQHYAPLVFGPFKKGILIRHAARKRRRQASFILKRFFLRVIAWIKVVLAIKMLTKNRLAYKRKNRRENAALRIQACLRRRWAINSFKKRKFSAVIIVKAMKKRREKFLKQKELEDELRFMRLVLRMQRIYRWNKNRKLEKIRRHIECEDVASRKIQKLFRKKWKRPVYLSEMMNTFHENSSDDEEDEDEVMILRIVSKPPLERCRGYWIEVDDETMRSLDSGDLLREGLVEGVDYSSKTMIVDFGTKENPEEYEVDYESPHIKQWFMMTSRKEQDRIVSAALKIQFWAKRRMKHAFNRGLETITALNTSHEIPRTRALLSHPTSPSMTNTHTPRSLLEHSDSTPMAMTTNTQTQTQSPTNRRQEPPPPSSDDSNPILEGVMILRPVPRPTLEKSVGYWISSPTDPEREAIIEVVDLEKRLLKAEYLDEDENLIVSYDDPLVSWYRMSTKHEEDLEINAVIRIQTIIRGRLARARVRKIRLDKNADISENRAAARIQKIFKRLNKPATPIVPSSPSSQTPPTAAIVETSEPTPSETSNTPVERKSSVTEEPPLLPDETELLAMDSPPAIYNCPGHWIVRSSNPDVEGQVEAVDLESQMMRVVYEMDSNSTQLRSVEVSYHEPDLLWYEESQQTNQLEKSNFLFTEVRKPSFENVLGYYILLNGGGELAETGSETPTSTSNNPLITPQADMALVIDVIPTNKSLKVQFIQNISRDGRVICENEIEEVGYFTQSVVWLKGKLS